MKKIKLRISMMLLIVASHNSYSQSDAKFPIVKGHGGIFEIPYATINAEANIEYKIAIDVKMGSPKPGDTNPALYNIARLMNLHVLGGAKPENMHVVAIVHNLATTSIITDEAYQKKFNMDNPNTELIKALRDAGVRILICGQSMLARDVAEEELAEGVEVSLSMLTAFTTLQLQGYAALQF